MSDSSNQYQVELKAVTFQIDDSLDKQSMDRNSTEVNLSGLSAEMNPKISGGILKENLLSKSDNENTLSFDDLLNDIGFGRYQIKIYMIMASLALAEGAQVMVFTMMIPILEVQWGIQEWLNGLQTCLIFVSFLIGSMVSGQISDRVGRKKPIMFSSGMMFILALGSASSPNIIVLILFRVFLGLLVGFFAPLGATMLAELTPLLLRGKYMALIQLSLSFGMIFGICMGLAILSDLTHGNWRLLIAVCTLPGILAFLLSVCFLEESPRYELVLGNHESAFRIIDKINRMNGERKFKDLTPEQKEKLKRWSNNLGKNFGKEDVASVRALFKDHGKLITPLLWIDWFASSFIYYGIVIFLPDTIEKLNGEGKGTESHDFVQLLVSTVTELFAVFLAAMLIDLKHFGRKNSMIIFYELTAIVALIVYLDDKSHFIYWATISKFFITMTAVFCFQYTSEVYSTKCRTTGLGMASGIGRLGGMAMPWVCVSLADINPVAPFLAFASLGIVVGIINCLLPYDTTGKALDTVEN